MKLNPFFCLVLTLAVAGLPSCMDRPSGTAAEDILLTEQAFEKMVRDSGITVAFTHFAAPEAILLRENDSLIHGRRDIYSYYERHQLPGLTLTWKPDTVIVSAGEDLGYTYGRYQLGYKDSSGQSGNREGIFHTIWKKQPDGSWRFVWD